MTESTMTKIKRIQVVLLVLVFVMLFFGGCGDPEADIARSEERRVGKECRL